LAQTTRAPHRRSKPPTSSTSRPKDLPVTSRHNAKHWQTTKTTLIY
jgi:hypothetical protein